MADSNLRFSDFRRIKNSTVAQFRVKHKQKFYKETVKNLVMNVGVYTGIGYLVMKGSANYKFLVSFF